MERVDCKLDKLGEKVTKIYKFSRAVKLPFSLHGVITSGYYGNIYAATRTKGAKKIGIKVTKDVRRGFIVKLMHNVKYNIRDVNRMIKANLLVRSQICPHFPIIYGQFYIDNVNFLGIDGKGVTKSQNIYNRVSNGPGIGVMMEDLGHLTMENYVFWNPDTEELRQILFQCYVGIYAIIRYMNMNHGDFHFKNVMLIPVENPMTFQYYIDGQMYKVVAKRFYPIIIDINGNAYGKKVNQMSDIKHINKFMKRFVPKHFTALNLFLETTSISVFFKRNFSKYKVANTIPTNDLIGKEKIYSFY